MMNPAQDRKHACDIMTNPDDDESTSVIERSRLMDSSSDVVRRCGSKGGLPVCGWNLNTGEWLGATDKDAHR